MLMIEFSFTANFYSFDCVSISAEVKRCGLLILLRIKRSKFLLFRLI